VTRVAKANMREENPPGCSTYVVGFEQFVKDHARIRQGIRRLQRLPLHTPRVRCSRAPQVKPLWVISPSICCTKAVVVAQVTQGRCRWVRERVVEQTDGLVIELRLGGARRKFADRRESVDEDVLAVVDGARMAEGVEDGSTAIGPSCGRPTLSEALHWSACAGRCWSRSSLWTSRSPKDAVSPGPHLSFSLIPRAHWHDVASSI